MSRRPSQAGPRGHRPERRKHPHAATYSCDLAHREDHPGTLAAGDASKREDLAVRMSRAATPVMEVFDLRASRPAIADANHFTPCVFPSRAYLPGRAGFSNRGALR